MKLKKSYIATLLGLSIATASYAQDLIRQVPEHASFVFVINNPAIVKHSSFEKINEVLETMGTFDHIDQQDVEIQSITDLDLSYDRSAYIYKTDTDSSHYTGILLPLKQGHQIETNLFSKLSPLPASGGYERRVSTDGKTQVAWNEHTAFILTGDARDYYFETDSVAQRYGIELPDYGYGYSPAATNDYDYAYPVDDYVVSDYVADSISAIADSIDAARDPYDAPPETDYDDYLGYDAYSDSTYQKERARQAKNDSLRNAAFVSWLAQDFDNYLHPAQHAGSNKQLSKFDKRNTLVHFWARDLISIYRQTLPYSMVDIAMQMGYNMENLFNMYEDIVFDLVQDKHTLKLQGSVGLHKDMERKIMPVYKHKMNRKFARYIPENHISYLSLNLNAEAYLRNFPSLFNHMYGGSTSMYFAFGEVADVIATALEIALDEKAIAKVIGGDHLLFINEMKKVQKEYIDYEYDSDTFDYNEVKKTKDDYVPTFLWMFTSKDQRIYHKLLDLGEFRENVTQIDGIYRIADNPTGDILHVLFKDDIVFVSNDKEQLVDIQTNRFRASGDRQIKKQISGNNMTAVTHLSHIPETINQLGIPVIKQWDRTVNNLSQYGDVTITAKGHRKGRITGEIAVDFPEQEANALQYLLEELLNTIR